MSPKKKCEGLAHLIIVSDRANSLVPAVADVLREAFNYHCTQHLAENVGNEYGKIREYSEQLAVLDVVIIRARLQPNGNEVVQSAIIAHRYDINQSSQQVVHSTNGILDGKFSNLSHENEARF